MRSIARLFDSQATSVAMPAAGHASTATSSVPRPDATSSHRSPAPISKRAPYLTVRARVGVSQLSRTRAQLKENLNTWKVHSSTLTVEARASLVERILKSYRYSQNIIDLNGLNLQDLPNCFGQLQMVRQLELKNNFLNSVPSSIGQSSGLEYLGLSENELTSLPDSIGQLPRLVHVDLSGNKLTTVPHCISQLTWLAYIDLSHNNLTSLPSRLFESHGTQRVIKVLNNPISSLPDSDDQSTTIKLEWKCIFPLQFDTQGKERTSYLLNTLGIQPEIERGSDINDDEVFSNGSFLADTDDNRYRKMGSRAWVDDVSISDTQKFNSAAHTDKIKYFTLDTITVSPK